MNGQKLIFINQESTIKTNKMAKTYREIPYNYTSAEDNQVIEHLFGTKMVKVIEKLRPKRTTGRSARLQSGGFSLLPDLSWRSGSKENMISSGGKRCGGCKL